MHAERDYLRDHVFPELEERLRARHEILEPIDLRQGVELASLNAEQARELKVLKVCLDEIERSRPFLLVLLGDRYGWVPPPERIAAAAQEAGFATDGGGQERHRAGDRVRHPQERPDPAPAQPVLLPRAAAL